MCKSTGKNISKNLSSKYRQKLLNHAKQSAKDALKKQLVIWLGIKVLTELQKFQKLDNRII